MAPKRGTRGVAGIPSAAAPTAPRGRGRPPKNRNPQASVRESYQEPEMKASEQFSQHFSDEEFGSAENQSDHPQAPQSNPSPADAQNPFQNWWNQFASFPYAAYPGASFPGPAYPGAPGTSQPGTTAPPGVQYPPPPCSTHLILGIFRMVFLMFHPLLLRTILQCHKIPDLLPARGHLGEITLLSNFLMLKKWVARILMVLTPMLTPVIGGSRPQKCFHCWSWSQTTKLRWFPDSLKALLATGG